MPVSHGFERSEAAAYCDVFAKLHLLLLKLCLVSARPTEKKTLCRPQQFHVLEKNKGGRLESLEGK